jgi:hypothetical protein
MQSHLTDADDYLVHQTIRPMGSSGNGESNWFDRFYFNVHDRAGDFLALIGLGLYPNVGITDGYACIGTPGVQTNIRFARRTGPAERLIREIGPFSFRIIEPLAKWSLALKDVPNGVSLDLVAEGRLAPFNFEPIGVEHNEGGHTRFAHFIQPMRYTGMITVEDRNYVVDGWLGQRDRSWGIRRTREQLGMHVWFSAQFSSGTIAFNYNETRDHRLSHCDGAYVRADGTNQRIVNVANDVDCDLGAGGRVNSGRFTLLFEDGQKMHVSVEGRNAAVQLAGAGYDGRHGTSPEGRELELERWDMTDPAVVARLPFRVINQCAQFDREGEAGNGVLEFGLSRSSSYGYRPRPRSHD